MAYQSKKLRNRPLRLEQLHSREVMAGDLAIDFSGGLLSISGTSGPDQIRLSRQGDSIELVAKSSQGDLRKTYAASKLSAIEVRGMGGDDLVGIFDQLPSVRIQIDGGDGRDQIFSTSQLFGTDNDPEDYVVSADMARVYQQLQALGVDLGGVRTNVSNHRNSFMGVVQQFEFGDLRLNGLSGEVYIAKDRGVQAFALVGENIQLSEFEPQEYYQSNFMNYRSKYTLSPTLVVLTHGLDDSTSNNRSRGFSWSGDQLKGAASAWTLELGSNFARELNAAGSMAHVMFIDWPSASPSSSATKFVAEHIREFLKTQDNDWDVSLIGHSRGAIFNSDVADLLSSAQMAKLQQVLLDPTAAVSMNDKYPTKIADSTDFATVYDDGLTLYPAAATREGLPIAGAAYRRVFVPGAGDFDSTASHNRMPTLYSNYRDARTGGHGSPELTFHRDADQLISKKKQYKESPITYSSKAGWELVIASPPSDGWNYVFDIGFDGNRNGDAVGYISVLSVGGASLRFGKSGLTINAGTTGYGNAAVSVTAQGLAAGLSGPGYSPLNYSGQVLIGPNETRVDLDIGPMRLALFGKDAGVFWGGKKVALDTSFSFNVDRAKINSPDVAKFLKSTFGATSSEVVKVLQGVGTNQGEIVKALVHGLQLSQRQIAETLYGNVTTNLRSIAGLMSNAGASLPQIVDAFSSQLKLSYRKAADAIYHGVTKDLRRIASALGKEGASLAQITDALDDELKVSYRKTTDAIYHGVTKNLRAIAAVLDKEGANLKEIVDAFDNQLNVSYRKIADAVYHGVTKDLRRIADVLNKEGASLKDIADALNDQLDVGYRKIADALYHGVTKDLRKIADVLNQEGASLNQIADALNDGLKASYRKVADAVYHGVTKNAQKIAKVLKDEGASAESVADALKQVGFNASTIDDALRNGAKFASSSISKALESVGIKIGKPNNPFSKWV